MDLSNLISKTCFIILILESITGLSGNLFISVVCFKKNKEPEKRNSNKIIASLAVSNIIHASTLTFTMLSWSLWPELYASLYAVKVTSYLIVYTVSSSVWLTTILCFFYFIKITNFCFFAWVKVRINKLINWMIFMAQVASTLCSSLNMLLGPAFSARNILASISNVTSPSQDIFLQNISFISNCFPMFIMVVTTASTLASLNLHSRRMRKNLGGSNNDSYMGVIRLMVRFLMFYALYYGAMIYFCFTNLSLESTVYWIIIMIAFLFTPVQSFFIISGTPNMKKSWENICRSIKDTIVLCARN